MSSRQDQTVAEGGTAIQTHGNVTIHQGMTPDQMSAIMIAMGRHLSGYTDDAKKLLDERFKEFREEILTSFADTKETNSEAFRDPDFQYMLSDAQKGFARSGEDELRDTLIDIISRRSLEPTGSILARTLNEAASRAASLGPSEFAELSLCYLVRYTQRFNISNLSTLCEYIQKFLMPFVPSISRERSSYWHIEAQSCGTLENLSAFSVNQSLRVAYGGVLGFGIDRKTLEDHLPDGKKNVLDRFIIPCVNDHSKLQPNAISADQFKERVANVGLTIMEVQNIWSAFQATIPEENELIVLLSKQVPNVDSLFKAFSETPLQHLSLNSVGIAIGHAHAVKKVGFEAPLNVWIK